MTAEEEVTEVDGYDIDVAPIPTGPSPLLVAVTLRSGAPVEAGMHASATVQTLVDTLQAQWPDRTIAGVLLGEGGHVDTLDDEQLARLGLRRMEVQASRVAARLLADWLDRKLEELHRPATVTEAVDLLRTYDPEREALP